MAGVGVGASAGGLCSRAAALAAGRLRGRRGPWSICRGSDVRFGVRGPPRWPLDFCVAGVGFAAV